MSYMLQMEIIEARGFSRKVAEEMSDAEYYGFQEFLVQNADAGAIIPGSRGLRKIRWGLRGIGKRGGVRIIYFLKNAAGQLFLLHMYRKSEMENLPLTMLRYLRSQVDD
jgi:hypothetical protein